MSTTISQTITTTTSSRLVSNKRRHAPTLIPLVLHPDFATMASSIKAMKIKYHEVR